jgi:hypothetical protein
MKCIVSEKIKAKLDKYKFVGYLKEIIGYYLYHLVEKKCLSKNMLYFFLIFLEGKNKKKIELEKVQEP